VKLVLYPGEPHGLQEFVHQKRKLEEDLAWFKKYLFDTYEPPNEALKQGSPLDRALRRQRAQQVGSRYGVEMKGKLVPEVVDYQGMEVGRFEVTRAQFAAFDPSYQFEAGTENLPANGIRFEQAKAYADWLSQLSGDAYRLPTAEEAATLYEAGSDTENTLDYWAGYAPNPDDAARLGEKIAVLPGGAPLLREVGHFNGRGDGEAVFDLGGNVAEWTTGPNGEAVLAGGSADRSTDPRASETTAGEAYRGFRVVRGEPR
jgi:formylglycine-generating enzyme required for sulfatase activity